METTVPILIGLITVVLLCLGAVLDDRRARVRRRAQREEPVRAVPLLHSINDDRCIGCEACVDVCPTEVLDLVDHKVRVVRFSDCVQCEQCAVSCPTQALVMYRQGTTPRMLTVPELDEHFQTGVPGQYLIGEVAGKPLVKNAANLGRAVIEHIARELASLPPAQRDAGDVLDVVIVGSGPGGLSAGLACNKHRMSCLVLEKEHVMASTVSRYPKGKHFMAEPCTSQNVSYLPVFDGTKEQLVAAWQQVVDGVKLPLKLGEAVETVQRGDDGVFTIRSTVGTYRARTVVLATGLRGKPRLLVVPGANLEKVQSLLDDPAEFAGEDVLVVGGGDSAVEGAMSLVDVGANVTLSYRGDGFKRCKQGNQKRLAEMTAANRIAVLLESNVTCFTPDSVTIALADRSETTIANQRAFVLIGADTPVAWLETNHVRFVERPHLYALGSTEEVVRRFAPDATECPRSAEEALAILLDRPLPRSSGRLVHSVVEHLRDELREVVAEVVTSVSSAFRLSDVQPPRPSSKLIPASRLVARRPPAPRTDQVALLNARERQARANAARRPKEETTLEIASLPTLERQAVEALRHPPTGTTMEIASLPERERQALAALQRLQDGSVAGSAVNAARPAAAPPSARQSADDETTFEHASLRTLERAALPRTAPLPAGDGTTIEAGSLRTRVGSTGVERPSPAPDETTDVDLPSLHALEGSIEIDVSPGALDATELDRPSLRALDGAGTGVAPRRANTTSVITSAARPPPLRASVPPHSPTGVSIAPPHSTIQQALMPSDSPKGKPMVPPHSATQPAHRGPPPIPPARTAATPPSAPTAATPPSARTAATPPPARTAATAPPVSTAATPPPARTAATPPPARTAATPPPVRTAATPPHARTAAPPPPLPRRSPRLAYGSETFATQPTPTIPPSPLRAETAEAETAGVTSERAPVVRGTTVVP